MLCIYTMDEDLQPMNPISCLKPRDTKPEFSPRPTSRETATRDRGAVVCASRFHEITNPDMKIAVNSNHRHVFSNPGGMLFEIGCFSEAWVSFAHGEATDEFSWFSGYRWCYASCGRCLTHLGWFFLGQRDSDFWGLVLNRLESESRTLR